MKNRKMVLESVRSAPAIARAPCEPVPNESPPDPVVHP